MSCVLSIVMTSQANYFFASGISLIIFLVWWVVLFFILGKGSFEMEPGGRPFEPLMSRYFEVAKLIISLAVGSIALLAGYVGYVIQKDVTQLKFVQLVIAWPLAVLAFSVIFGVFFLASLARSYEKFLHDKWSYTRPWYALNQALGFSCLTCFALGYFVLAFSVIALAFD